MLTDAYHVEKYIVPGAFAIAQLILLPWYLLGGTPLGIWDLGTVLVLALVAGHLIESLKVYQWHPKVKTNYATFTARIEGMLGAWGLTEGIPKSGEKALTVLFTVLPPPERSEWSWNLVRWQKMTVIAVILSAGGLEWLLFAALYAVTPYGHNPFNSSFALAIFRCDISRSWTLLTEILFGVVCFIMAYSVNKFAVNRQERNNESYFQLIRRHKDYILEALREGKPKEEKKP